MGGVANLLPVTLPRVFHVQKHDLAARGHHLAYPAVGGAEHALDNRPLVFGERADLDALPNQDIDLVLGHGLLAGLPDAKQPQNAVGGYRQQPHDGRCKP